MINTHILTALRLSIIPLITAAIYSPSLLAETEPYIESPVISVTASRVATEIKDTPATIEIIDATQLDTVKFTDSVTELLNRIPGNSLSRNLRIPMGGKNYTINLIDGMAARSFGRGTNGFIDEVNTFDIERVEVIKGPASSLYGSNALGGVINVITRNPPTSPEYRVWGEAGNHGRGRGGFSAAGPITNSLGYFFDTNFLDYEGSQERTALERKTISGKLIYDVDVDTSFSVRTEYLETTEESPGSLTQAQFDADWQQAAFPDAFTDQQMATATFSFTSALGSQSEIDLKYSIRRHEEQGMPSWSATSNYGEDDMLNHNLVATYHRNFDFLDSRLIAGIDLQRAEVEEIGHTGRSTSSPVDLSDSWDILARVTSPFLQYEFSPIDRTRITLGVRRDRVKYGAEIKDGSFDEEREFTSTSPKAGITFDLDDNNSLWFGYSEGFVVPSRSALYTSGWHIPDPNLKAEEAENFELGIRGRLMGGKFKYDVALYDTTIENMVVTEDIPGPRDRYVNAGEVEVKGLEASLSYKLIEQLRFDAAYTYAKNTYLDYVTSGDDYSGETMSSSPLHHMNFRTTWMPRHDLDVELEWDHLSAYHTHSNNDLDPRGRYKRPDLLHLRVIYEVGPWSIWGHVLNLTDRKYAKRASYDEGDATRKFTSGSERTFYTGVSYNW